mmetsp:Transcript_72612/g.225581  ORF Transcript_72612/g.225581 Transcript_72612/m.225581 type:complete len:210 (-) Transcript_72612:308-937(-)
MRAAAAAPGQGRGPAAVADPAAAALAVLHERSEPLALAARHPHYHGEPPLPHLPHRRQVLPRAGPWPLGQGLGMPLARGGRERALASGAARRPGAAHCVPPSAAAPPCWPHAAARLGRTGRQAGTKCHAGEAPALAHRLCALWPSAGGGGAWAPCLGPAAAGPGRGAAARRPEAPEPRGRTLGPCWALAGLGRRLRGKRRLHVGLRRCA